jgi:peptidoglycan hydrolase-like protein with peptidoglycan-binding domain
MWIQARLGGLVIDGDFGPKTELAVKTLQAAMGLAADGIVGAQTFSVLSWQNPAPL